MDYSVTFARHFSRLVWLLLNESQNVDEQKAALRATVTVSKDGPVTLGTHEWRLSVNGSRLPEALTGVQDLTAQMIGHAIREIAIDAAAAPADLLGLARILAAEAVPGDGGAAAEARVKALGAKTVRIRVAGLEAVTGKHPAIKAGVPAPAAGAPAPKRRSSGARTALGGGVVMSEDSGSYLAFAAVTAPKEAWQNLLQQLDNTKSVSVVTRLLDDLVTIAENFVREAKKDTASTIFHEIVRREAETADGDLKRAYVMAIRRLTKPTLLRAVAQMLPRRREKLEEYMLVLGRCGEDAADALIEQLTSAQSLSDRRIYFDGLVALKAGVPALIHMLGDARWYVARNAADLLGEMAAEEALGPLSELVKHDDDRVRRAAITALSKLKSPKALDALREAMRDSSAQVRMQAAAGMGTRKGMRTAHTLTKAFENEEDQEVQLAIISSLGRIATSDAVQRLIKIAEPGGAIFNKKPVALRVAAVQALGEARTPAAQNALQNLLDDKEKEVKQAVFRLLMQGSAKES